MKRLLIPFVAAFGLSLGIATGVVTMRSPKAALVAKVGDAKRDSAKSKSAKHDSSSSKLAASPVPLASTQPAATHSEPVPTPVPTHTPATDGGAPAVVTQASQPPVATAAVQASASQDTIAGGKLAKVFGAMQARDAARVLEQMEDGDVRTILASLSNKQQAAILGTFPTQRAATIMRATLRDIRGRAVTLNAVSGAASWDAPPVDGTGPAHSKNVQVSTSDAPPNAFAASLAAMLGPRHVAAPKDDKSAAISELDASLKGRCCAS
ncbi:MAG: hypothetical protein ACR2M1_00515 [Gemmatimonadaceae bacterium]